MEQQAKKIRISSEIADYTLLTRRIEQAVIRDNENPKCRDILARKEIWGRLSSGQALEWAGLAQIAGLMDTALEIYKTLVQQSPPFEAAWKARIELLDILDKKQELASAVQQAAMVLDKEQVLSWVRPAAMDSPGPAVMAESPATALFETMHSRQAMMLNFTDLFFCRTDVFARQWADQQKKTSGYVPVRRPFTPNDLEDHFKGLKTYGFYLMGADATVRCAAIDADLVPELRPPENRKKSAAKIKKDRTYMISRIREDSRAMGLYPVIEYSGGKGFHFWYFMKKPVQASMLRKALGQITAGLCPDLSCFHLEVFPKQDHLSGKGLGNLIKLPLGIHRQTGKRSYFPECPKKDVDSQLKFLSKITRSDPEAIQFNAGEASGKKVILHPELKALSQKYPGLFELERQCPALGQICAYAREHRSLGSRQEKILLQTLGFLPGGRRILHYLFSGTEGYNPHMVDYKISRVRGNPLGCRRIHSLTGYDRDYCRLEPDRTGYIHPLIHVKEWRDLTGPNHPKSERIENLTDAVEQMKTAILVLEKFLT